MEHTLVGAAILSGQDAHKRHDNIILLVQVRNGTSLEAAFESLDDPGRTFRDLQIPDILVRTFVFQERNCFHYFATDIDRKVGKNSPILFFLLARVTIRRQCFRFLCSHTQSCRRRRMENWPSLSNNFIHSKNNDEKGTEHI